MSTQSALLVIDTITAALNTQIRLQQVLEKAAIEGRDNITLEELEAIMKTTDALEDEILSSSHEPSTPQ